MAGKRKGPTKEITGCPIRFLEQREFNSSISSWAPDALSSAFLSRKLDISKNLYQKNLYAHYGCVNAIEFSAEGDLLVSGQLYYG